MAYKNKPKLNKSAQVIFKNVTNFPLQFILAILVFCNGILFLFAALVLIPLKTIVFICAKIFRPDLKHFAATETRVLSQGDGFSEPKMNSCGLLLFDGPIDLIKLRSLFQSRILEKKKPNGDLVYPELKMFWVNYLQYTFWKEDENFELENHIRLYDHKEDVEVENSCEKRISRIFVHAMEKKWKIGRSPWELLVLNNYKYSESKKGSILVFRYHHAIADGYSSIKLSIKNLMLVDPNINVNYPEIKGLWKKLGLYAIFPFKLSWDIAKGLLNIYDSSHCWNQRRIFSGKLHVCVSKPFQIDLIKQIKNKHGVSYNSVLCAAALGACKRLMEEAGQIVPKEISCFFPVPMKGHPEGLVNHASSLFFKLPCDHRISREERLYSIYMQMAQSQYDTAPLGFFHASKCLNLLPNFCLRIANIFPCTVAIAPLPIALRHTTFHGMDVNLVDSIGISGPGIGKTGTIITMNSINGKQRFAINIDKGIFPRGDIFEKYGDFVEDELNWFLKSESGTTKYDKLIKNE